jgi:hypothetical protein
LHYLRVKILLTAVAADGRSACGSSSATGGEAGTIEPQKNAKDANRFGLSRPSE